MPASESAYGFEGGSEGDLVFDGAVEGPFDALKGPFGGVPRCSQHNYYTVQKYMVLGKLHKCINH